MKRLASPFQGILIIGSMTVILNIRLWNKATETEFGEIFSWMLSFQPYSVYSAKFPDSSSMHLRAVITRTSTRCNAQFFTYIILNLDLPTTLSLTKRKKKTHTHTKGENYTATSLIL